MISSLFPALISAFKACRELALENVALRQQLAVLRRSVKRPRLSKIDRGFWVLLHRIWADWESVLVIVKPETVVRWHRCGFRRYWTWKSRRRRPGRPGVACAPQKVDPALIARFRPVMDRWLLRAGRPDDATDGCGLSKGPSFGTGRRRSPISAMRSAMSRVAVSTAWTVIPWP